MGDERRLFTHQTDQLLTVLNRQRHDWLNHVQVLLGYLHLNRTEQGEAHLKRIAQMAMQESMVARLNSSLLSVFFLTFNALNNELLLEVDVCNHVDLTRVVLSEQDLFQLVSEILCTVNDHVDQSGYEPASMQVSLQMDECGVHFRFDLAGILHASGMEELEKLIRKSEQSTVEVTEWIHTEEEWVLNLVVPFAE
ncbi:stage 0 sporulation protein B (sporulation initiation phosphotransferase) [Brevibacillus sp. AG162]|uniref:Spo0B C-terminal domain-containing protein n=1 Tax=Brevibacillus sp. AG162 TaxID=2572910 RepID=UPI00115444C1|nr:Spo0B C-terminal domain-containing protein [Brevibacillus sp. AG162]TQK73598.1 stage 0 sporulation protein B (sporulation initiation phosphotransferase) [Brevibacillus sp. AG162]